MQNNVLQRGAQAYNSQHGLPRICEGIFVSINATVSRAIANAYEALPLCDLGNPLVIAAYQHLACDVQQQYAYVQDTLGILIEPWCRKGQPYVNSAAMMADV